MTEALDWTLAPVPSPLVEAHPRVCLVGVKAYRHGVLAGRWLDLRTPAPRLSRQVESLARSTPGGRLGVFDYECVPGGIADALTISELLRRCQE